MSDGDRLQHAQCTGSRYEAFVVLLHLAVLRLLLLLLLYSCTLEMRRSLVTAVFPVTAIIHG